MRVNHIFQRMRTQKNIPSSCSSIVTGILLLTVMMCMPTKSYALLDTTIFKIRVIQDSVYAGDTVDVDFLIGDPSQLGILNILNQFEFEVVTDTSLIEQDKIQSKIDTLSLTTFFGTVITNILSIVTIDPLLGKLNIKTNSSTTSSGNARVARGKYIVQDNAAGRQYMHFDYTKAVSKGLLGLSNPVRMYVDSVLILGSRPTVPTAIKVEKNNKDIRIYPNPSSDMVRIEGEKISEVRLLSADGKNILYETKQNSDNININLSAYSAGLYIIMIKQGEEWTRHNIVRK